MFITSVVDIDSLNTVNSNTFYSKLEKEVYFKLVGNSNLVLDVLFQINLKSFLSRIITVVHYDESSEVGSILLNCKTQYKFLRNILQLRPHKQLVVFEYSKLPLMLLELIFRNSKLAQLFFQTTNSLMRNLSADEGNAIVNGGWLKSVNIKETVSWYWENFKQVVEETS